ncbi:MAG: primosomal protein N' [Thermoanaerobaculia bacterium]
MTYEVPEVFAGQAVPGARVRVPVGRRKVTGFIVGVREEAPEGVQVRPLEAVVDPWPVVPEELLELARFIADYYVAPPGEVLRAMIPSGVAPWGERRVWLTDGGALALPGSREEQRIVEALRAGGTMKLSELQAATGLTDLPARVERMRTQGRLAIAETRTRGTRYVQAVELAGGALADLLEACGRSVKGREVVEYLAAAGRPATVAEVTREVECGGGVVRRLVGLDVLRSFTQAERLDLAGQWMTRRDEEPFRLKEDQRAALAALESGLEDGCYRPFLLAGATGTGKTEVYLRAADLALRQGRGVLLLVPEIALVPALAGEARRRFGRRLAILHSALGASERQQEWERIRGGEARVVLGPRSALFAPVADLGLLVVDEEHDTSYKQETTPRYNARDLALVRAHREGAVAVLVSATPSLETRRNVEIGKLARVDLVDRLGQGAMPEGILVDLKQEKLSRRPGEVHFSPRLKEEIENALAGDEQIILLRNRRGYAPMLLCRACGEDMRCEDCGLPRTLHRRESMLRCHYCGSSLPAPARCPECDEEALEPIGAGTERVEEDFAALFPGVPVGVLDRDVSRRRGGAAAALEAFGRGDTRVLVGTQMVAKGHHFPNVALAAVLLADTYLGFPDFRAVERTYSLLTQLAASGAGGPRRHPDLPPDHYAIQAALRHDDDAFGTRGDEVPPRLPLPTVRPASSDPGARRV